MSKIKYPTIDEFEKDAEGVLEDLVRVFEDTDKALKWFYTPSIGLNNESPYEYHKKGLTKELKEYLHRIEHGIYC